MTKDDGVVLRGRLASFFQDNPTAEFQVGEKGCLLNKPWGDPTIEIRIKESSDNLIQSLNSVVLPPRFTALWHKDTRDLEFIWTTAPVDSHLRSRSFDFTFRQRVFKCQFGDSSQRLLDIAEAARPLTPATDTDHRGLYAFNLFLHYRKEHPDDRFVSGKAPTSFWIRQIDWQDEFVLELCRNLNFYMYYFDPDTPVILIHEEAPKTKVRLGPFKPSDGTFPPHLAGRPLDPYLLILWTNILRGDPFLRFLYSYQILEYSAFYHLQEEALQLVRRVLVSPETPGQIDEASHRILDALCDVRSSDEAKVVAVVKKCVDPAMIWKQIEPNRDFFTAEVVFDGGFTLSPLLKSDWNAEDFSAAWIPAFPDALRRIRNAMVHSREARMAKSIIRTRDNHMKLRAWVGPIVATAMQVMIYRDL